MPPAGELPFNVGPAQSAVGLNGEVSQVPVDSVHVTLHPSRTVLVYSGRPKQDVTTSTVFAVLDCRSACS
jgi:hypothetical protein